MSRRRGFTLLELMVTICLIGMLSSLVLFAMVKAQSQARVARTKATIGKLDALIKRRWDSYLIRRVPVSTANLSATDAKDAKVLAELRLVALRQLMRLEMPDNWDEVKANPSATPLKRFTTSGNFGSPAITLTPPALFLAYQRYYQSISNGIAPGNVPSSTFENAECLYMIVTLGAMDEGSGRELFTEAEVGDVDHDGAPEFVDAWGMPIRFLRWPSGFMDDGVFDSFSAAMGGPGFGHLSDLVPSKSPNSALINFGTYAANNHDPFDVRKIDPSFAYAMYPLIYSAGPDKIEDIYSGPSFDSANPYDPYRVRDDPYVDTRSDPAAWGSWDTYHYNPLADLSTSAGRARLLGVPHDLDAYRNGLVLPVNSVLNHYDNITNHQITGALR